MSVDIRQISVFMLGFFVGAIVAHVIVPGSVTMWVATGLAVGLFASAYVAETNGGGFFASIGGFISATPGEVSATRSKAKSHGGISGLTMAAKGADPRKPRRRVGSRGSVPRRKQERRQRNHVVCGRLPSRMPHRPTTT